MLASDESRTLIDDLLAEQQQLTAVERFSRQHEHAGVPAQAKYYRDLIPLTLPQPGQQYAFEVDLDRCSGCKSCVSACHSLNGLDDGEAWRDVGLLVSDDWRHPFQQTVTTACHHCVDPGCLNGCPVLAYDKDPLTGIVRHLDDQCIGCQYCVMKCPYDVPKYSAKRGIVRKCDMCHSRLTVGEAPACAQACPHEAIRITLVETRRVREKIENNIQHPTSNIEHPSSVARPFPETWMLDVGCSTLDVPNLTSNFVPSSPDPRITLPTTRYKSAQPLPSGLLAGDHARVTRSEAHLPLVFMLVLTQLAVGASVAAVWAQPAKWLALVAAVVGALALGIASLHLGKPLKAWRAFLGWRKSWFSREVILFGAYAPLAALDAAAFWLAPLAPIQKLLALAAAATGLLGVACSAMIYADTRREFWCASQCFGKFFGTTLLLGTALTVAVTNSTGWPLLALLCVVTAAKLAFEQRIFRHLPDSDAQSLTSLNKTARLLVGEMGVAARARVACGIFGGLILPLLAVLIHPGAKLALATLALCLLGELLERYLFFTAVAPVKMPGGLPT
jgi:Fe-S-cluster-containing dehydrogenase component/DMSO reductase anchor subunit